MTYHEELAKTLTDWIKEADHFNVVHFAVEAGLSKDELIRLAGESACLQKALDYAFTVMEWKVAEGALNGQLDRVAALKMLETYSGWKSDVNIIQKNEYKQFMNEAKVRAEQILRGESIDDAEIVKEVSDGDI
jgi:hypothetical protein